MKDKLRTLKDIKEDGGESDFGNYNYKTDNEVGHILHHFNEDLRLEAIRWIKYFDMGEKEIFQNWNIEHARPIKIWIKHFFNITDKELDNEE